MQRRFRFPGLADLFAVAGYAALVGIWLAVNQETEEAIGYTAWFLSLPLLSAIVGLVVGRPWALVLAIIPTVATSPFWGVGCEGDDLCFRGLVLARLLPLCLLGLGTGVLLRRTWPIARQAVPLRTRAVARRALSTLEERHFGER
jgi:hypothetical protein